MLESTGTSVHISSQLCTQQCSIYWLLEIGCGGKPGKLANATHEDFLFPLLIGPREPVVKHPPTHNWVICKDLNNPCNMNTEQSKGTCHFCPISASSSTAFQLIQQSRCLLAKECSSKLLNSSVFLQIFHKCFY